MLKDNMAFKGEIWVHTRKIGGGPKVLVAHFPNLVVDAGKAVGVTRLVGNAKAALSHIGVGVGTTAPNSTQTDLLSPLGARVPFDGTPVVNGKTVTMSATFGAAYVGTISEFGLFNAVTDGDMFSRAIRTPGIPKIAEDETTVTWAITAP